MTVFTKLRWELLLISQFTSCIVLVQRFCCLNLRTVAQKIKPINFFYEMLFYINKMCILVFTNLSLFGSISPSESWSAGHALQDLCSCSQVRSSLFKSAYIVVMLLSMLDLQFIYVCVTMFWLYIFAYILYIYLYFLQRFQLLSTVVPLLTPFFPSKFPFKVTAFLSLSLFLPLTKCHLSFWSPFRLQVPFPVELGPYWNRKSLCAVKSASVCSRNSSSPPVGHEKRAADSSELKNKSLFRSTSIPCVTTARWIGDPILCESYHYYYFYFLFIFYLIIYLFFKNLLILRT